MQKVRFFLDCFGQYFYPTLLLKKRAKAKKATASLSSPLLFFSNRVTNNCSPLSKNNRNHRVKTLVKKRGAACLPKKDAEDDISAFMSPLSRLSYYHMFRPKRTKNVHLEKAASGFLI